MAEPTVQHLITAILRQRDEALAAAANAQAALAAAMEENTKLLEKVNLSGIGESGESDD